MKCLARLASPILGLLLAVALPAAGAASIRADDPPPPPAGEGATPPVVTPGPAGAPPPGAPPGPPLEPPRWRLAVTLASGTSSGHSYLVFGGLLGYEVAGGLEVYLDGQYWGGAQPSVGRLAPGVNWYAPLPYRPYLGVYYARWFVGGQPDQDALGGRAGITLASGPHAALGVGMAYEQALDCSFECAAWWPEVSVGFRF